MSGQRVGVVGDGTLAAAVEGAGGTAVREPAASLAGVELVVAGGEDALVDLVRAGVEVPVLAVDAGAGVRSVAGADAEAAIERAIDGAGEVATERHPVLAPAGAADEVRALFDVALMAAEPARISEFAVDAAGDRIARFRADGVVASTPAGSVGYNRAAEGPLLAAGTGVCSVVPIAPFATHADRWVIPADEVTLSVERDETPVELLVDGRIERTVAAGDPVSLGTAGTLELVVDPAGARPL